MSAEGWAALGTFVAAGIALTIAVSDQLRHHAERVDADAGQARLVTADATHLGGLKIIIENNSQAPIIGPELDDVAWIADQASRRTTWELMTTVRGASTTKSRLLPGDKMEIPVRLLDETGQPVVTGVGHYRITFSFFDARGLEWSRVGNSQPQRVLNRWWRRSVRP